MGYNEEANNQISVVMTTYNGSEFIRAQLDSILCQTVLPAEIVIVDDCSSDNTFDILKYYADMHSIIKIYRNDINLGAHQNFRKAFSLSSFPLIAPSDQDDIWREDKLELLRTLLLEKDVDLVYSQEEILWENGGVSFSMQEMPDVKRLMWGNNLKGHTFLFRRDLLRVFDVAKDLSFDYALALKACVCGSYASTKEPLSTWRRHLGCCTTAVTEHSELIIDKATRKEKIQYTASHLTKEKSSAMEKSFLDRGRVLAMDMAFGRLVNVCNGVAKQTLWSMARASINNAIVWCDGGGLKSALARFFWAMRQPWIYWYDMHKLHALE